MVTVYDLYLEEPPFWRIVDEDNCVLLETEWEHEAMEYALNMLQDFMVRREQD